MSLLLALAAAAAPPDPPAAASPVEIIAQAPAGEWQAIAPADLLVMDLSPDARGAARRVVIQLIPPPFSQGWIGNIRKLAAAHWWDGLSINRVQDNYVVQWGDGAAENKVKARKLPTNLSKVPQSQYASPTADLLTTIQEGGQHRPAPDAYAPGTAIHDGWPIGHDALNQWPVHCYGTVGVGRDMPPDTGSGAELYAVIGHAPRHLDRNIAVIGRVIEGIEHLSSLPRGTAPLGFYAIAGERTPIRQIRLGSDLPGLPAYQYLSTGSASFAAYADARANRRDGFFVRPAGGADICNIPVPVRRAPWSIRSR